MAARAGRPQQKGRCLETSYNLHQTVCPEHLPLCIVGHRSYLRGWSVDCVQLSGLGKSKQGWRTALYFQQEPPKGKKSMKMDLPNGQDKESLPKCLLQGRGGSLWKNIKSLRTSVILNLLSATFSNILSDKP